jgi:hypothetical protein
MSLELIWPYVKNYDNPTVEGYLTWAKEQKSLFYQFKYEQVKNNYYFIIINLLIFIN